MKWEEDTSHKKVGVRIRVVRTGKIDVPRNLASKTQYVTKIANGSLWWDKQIGDSKL